MCNMSTVQIINIFNLFFRNNEMFIIAIVFSLLACTKSLSEGDKCYKTDGSPGVCKAINDCPYAEDDFRKNLEPMKCGYSDFDPVICCGESLADTTPKISGRLWGGKTTTTERPKGKEFSSECDKAERRGQKAYDKCLEYQEKYVYPCRPGPTTGNIRVDECTRKPEQLIIEGEDAYEGEFPHMALLGYGNDNIILDWIAGGSIISERYVLTAGHCTYSGFLRPVKKIRVGILKRSDPVDSSKEYNVVAIPHPDYHSPIQYNDIALLRTDRDIELNKYVVPACLHDGGALFNSIAIITGWGVTAYLDKSRPDVLKKATVERFETSECEKKYPKYRLLPNGYNSTTQMCYGNRVSNQDTCKGDSGGPLQVDHPNIRCMYMVIGITATGSLCGKAGLPSIYTRVENYVPWIEEIVWP
ncbi:serine protease snake-like isoform X2 [Pieris napi]|uniref:serine protease snake-like isoform X2 n=1 Tax=Pieris napi TaxID=78633 RepID=UPI001FBA0405|nr:serine protease snake-like isoform X2 [Pieris napi]